MPSSRAHFHSVRGSVLIVAMIMAAIIGISLVSYLNLSGNSLKQAHRTFYSNSAMNLAEIGLEEAIACFNQLDNNPGAPAAAWPSSSPVAAATPWTINSTAYHVSTSPYTPSAVGTIAGPMAGPGTTSMVQVYVHHYDGAAGRTPVIVAKSTITQPGAASISKYIEVTLRKRSLFANGLVARNNVSWVGTPMADSWDSKQYPSPTLDTDGDGTVDVYDLDADGNGAPDPHDAYSVAERTANVIVGSVSGNIGLGGGEVWGYTKTGEFGTSSGGSVHPLGTTTDDPTRRTNDFNATFPPVTTPTPVTINTIGTAPCSVTTSGISNNCTLPNTGDVANTADGVYYYNFTGSDDIRLASKRISIAAGRKVVLILNNIAGGTDAIASTGTGGIDVNVGSTLDVYTSGDVKIAGNGMANDNNNPATTKFWGTNTTSQNIDVSGNGRLTAVVYAPNADVTLNGGGVGGLMSGAVVAKSIRMNGGTEFHYDDALSRLTTGNPYGISKWRELQSAAERNTYAAQISLCPATTP